VRRFEARLFLNGVENAVRVDVRGAGADAAVPAQRAGGQEFRLGCAAPLGKQRLHVVVIGVNVPDADRADLVRRVVGALGGDAAGLAGGGEFTAPGYDRAILYKPLVGDDVGAGNIANAMVDVADAIRTLTTDPKEDWVNDVVFVYYQGKDWVDDQGRRWLHTSPSLRYQGADGWEQRAVRADDLPASAGVKLLLLNVADPDGRPDPADAFGAEVMRYGFTDPAARPRLVGLLGRALTARVRLGEVIEYLNTELRAEVAAGMPFVNLHQDVRDRPVGRGGP
jgi:hypothetical protein